MPACHGLPHNATSHRGAIQVGRLTRETIAHALESPVSVEQRHRDQLPATPGVDLGRLCIGETDSPLASRGVGGGKV
jgi:hypothetical protein